MLTIERTATYAAQMADAVTRVIREFDTSFTQTLAERLREATACGDRQAQSQLGLIILQLQFGLARLGQYAGNLRQASVDTKFAQTYWRNVSID